MNRRQFIAFLGGAAAAWPLAARGQSAATPVIGFLSSRTPEDSKRLVAAFRDGLSEGGYVEARNIVVEYRWARGQYDRLPAMAAELVRLPVAVIVATGGEPTAQAAKSATSTVPIVFIVGSDPVRAGLVASLNRPGGNATGVGLLNAELQIKRLALLDEITPKAAPIAVLANSSKLPGSAPTADDLKQIEEGAHSLSRSIEILNASTEEEIHGAFAQLRQQRAQAVLVMRDPFFDTRAKQIVAAVAELRLPAIYQFRAYAEAGGLMSYGVNLPAAYRQIGVYAGRVLKGAKPADLPVIQAATFELVINLKTAKALGIAIPPSLLLRTDEVIE